jgi:hypothetical protein
MDHFLPCFVVSQMPEQNRPALQDPEVCERRGYHGPFKRTEIYESFPGWEGYGDCESCGSCRHVQTEENRKAVALGATDPRNPTPRPGR